MSEADSDGPAVQAGAGTSAEPGGSDVEDEFQCSEGLTVSSLSIYSASAARRGLESDGCAPLDLRTHDVLEDESVLASAGVDAAEEVAEQSFASVDAGAGAGAGAEVGAEVGAGAVVDVRCAMATLDPQLVAMAEGVQRGEPDRIVLRVRNRGKQLVVLRAARFSGDSETQCSHPCCDVASTSARRLVACVVCGTARHETCMSARSTRPRDAEWACGPCVQQYGHATKRRRTRPVVGLPSPASVGQPQSVATAAAAGPPSQPATAASQPQSVAHATPTPDPRVRVCAACHALLLLTVSFFWCGQFAFGDALPCERFVHTPLPHERTDAGVLRVTLPDALLRKKAAGSLRPLDLFLHFFSPDFWNLVASNTNAYAQQKRARKRQAGAAQRSWKPVCPGDVVIWVAILIDMGLVRCPSAQRFWDARGDHHRVFSTAHMTLHRWEDIKSYLHVNAPDPPPPAGRSGGSQATRPHDAGDVGDTPELPSFAHKLEQMLVALNKGSRSLVVPPRNMAIDEIIVRFSGRSVHTFVIKHKPNPEGYKLYAACDSKTGYVFHFLVCSRRASVCVPMPLLADCAGPSDVLTDTGKYVAELTLSLPKGTSVYMDSYFTSTPLFEFLHNMGYYATGTARKLRGDNYVPGSISVPDQRKNDVRHGTVATNIKGNVCRLMWFDNGPVYFQTTEHDSDGFVKKLRRRPRRHAASCRGTLEAWGEFPELLMEIPSIAWAYNSFMGYVAHEMRALGAGNDSPGLWSRQWCGYCRSKAVLLHALDPQPS